MPEEPKFFVGANEFFTSRNFPGEIDEVRVSDAALPPCCFLRLSADTPVDNEMLYLRFEELQIPSWWGGDEKPFVRLSTMRFGFPYYETKKNAAAPVMTDIVPGETVYAGWMAAEGSANVKALDMNRTDASAGSILAIDYYGKDGRPAQAMIDEDEFTIEFFCRFKSQMHEGYTPILTDGGYSLRWGFYGETSVLTNGVSMVFQCATTNVTAGGVRKAPSTSARGPTSFADGAWHHFALVYSRSANAVTGYVDYGDWAKLTLTPEAGHVFAADYTRLVFGGRTTGNRLCDIEFDEIRISSRALGPTEFLSTRHLTGCTRFWMHFNGNYSVDPLGRPFQPDATTSAGSGMTMPSFSTDVRSDTFVVGTDRRIVFAGNTNSIHLSQFGRVVASEQFALQGLRNVTAEAFIKINSLEPSADASKSTFLLNCDHGAASMPDWGLRTACYGDNQWYSTVVWCSPDPSVRGTMAVTVPQDGKWHHLAVTFEEVPNGEATNTTIRYYCDYRLEATKTVAYARWMGEDPSKARFVSGETWGTGHDYLLDEVRVTAGVLEPSAFLRKSRSGIFVIVR